MPIDVTPGSLAAIVISTLFWWTVLSPAVLLAVEALCDHRPRLRGALTVVVLAPPIVTLLPVAVMHGGTAAVAAAVAALALAAGVVLAVLGLRRAGRDPERARRRATAAFLSGVAGGMVGSFALVGALLFG
jgi:K+ transporter